MGERVSLRFFQLQPQCFSLAIMPWLWQRSGGLNSHTGNAILLKILQGLSSSAVIHSLSGTAYSVALMRYCAGRTIRTIEKIPMVTTSSRSCLSPPPKCPSIPRAILSGMSSQQQQQHGLHSCFSTIFVDKMMGSTISTTASGTFFLPHVGSG